MVAHRMQRRYSDWLEDNKVSRDFIVRRNRRDFVKISLVFIAVMIVHYFAGLTVIEEGSLTYYLVISFVTLAILCGFVYQILLRNRDFIMAVEFQNAMFASAAGLQSRFCMITKKDGAVVYFDPGFQRIFADSLKRGISALDTMLASEGVSEEDQARIFSALAQKQNARVIFFMKNEQGESKKYVLSVDPLPRPEGFFLIRAREFIEREGDNGLNPAANDDPLASALEGIRALPLLLSQLTNQSHEGMYAADATGKLTFVNAALEKQLGYEAGEIVSAQLGIKDIVYQADGESKLTNRVENLAGYALLIKKQGSLLRRHLKQIVTLDNERHIVGCTALVTDPEQQAVTVPSTETEVEVETQHAVTLKHFIENSPIAIALLDGEGRIGDCNQALRNLNDRFREEVIGRPFTHYVHSEFREEISHLLQRVLQGEDIRAKLPVEIRLDCEGTVNASLYFSELAGLSPGNKIILAHIIDTTEQKNLELRFAHSQKMQAVGQLAGGIAHDFNNLLTAMIGFCDLLLMRHPAGDPSFADIMQIKQNAYRAANLVRQLLAFSRRQTLQPKVLDITDVLAELSNLVRRLIGENIELRMVHDRDLGLIRVDQGQLEQVIINLAVNARDAMTNGGTLSVRTSNVTLNRRNSLPRDLIAPTEDDVIPDGEWALIEVADTGHGIPREIIQKIFEPFFSTKEVGSGTGLGLATVYGIVKQTGGYIFVASKVDEGTRFCLYFPRHNATAEKSSANELENAERATSADLTGKGTILLVEDETPVRIFAGRALRNKGYTVLEADNGETALELMAKHGSEVEVIITDVIMPGMNGPVMIEKVMETNPNVKVIFISGYAEDAFVKTFGTEREFNFLPKPFTLKQLASKVKEVTQGTAED
jgi:two-component system cell cycle sensor histidine kinase/response regulator CckA